MYTCRYPPKVARHKGHVLKSRKTKSSAHWAQRQIWPHGSREIPDGASWHTQHVGNLPSLVEELVDEDAIVEVFGCCCCCSCCCCCCLAHFRKNCSLTQRTLPRSKELSQLCVLASPTAWPHVRTLGSKRQEASKGHWCLESQNLFWLRIRAASSVGVIFSALWRTGDLLLAGATGAGGGIALAAGAAGATGAAGAGVIAGIVLERPAEGPVRKPLRAHSQWQAHLCSPHLPWPRKSQSLANCFGPPTWPPVHGTPSNGWQNRGFDLPMVAEKRGSKA